jgi:DNA-binding IclR family transcriptional regulator
MRDEAPTRSTEGKHGVQSMEVGMGLLRVMVNGQRSMALKDIAAAADMPAPKAHRYLVSLIRAGLVEQDPMTSRYDLGPFAMNIGLVAIDRMDRVRLGLQAIAALRDQINETTALAVWGDNGPVIVRWERPRRPITVNVVTGTTLDPLTSASGRVFSAWLPEAVVSRLIRRRMREGQLPLELQSPEGVQAMLEKVRQDGFASVSDYHLVPGVEALAAPVFNFRQEISLALLVVGVKGLFDMSAQGQVVRQLKQAAQELSIRLGFNPLPVVQPQGEEA